MSSPFTSIVDGTDLFQVDFVNEMVGGCRERYYALFNAYPPTSLSLVSVGDPLQDKDFWKDMQLFVDSYHQSFVNHDRDIEGTSTIAYWGTTPFREYCNTEYGTSVHGWRRATTWPTDWMDPEDAAYSFGYVQAGDILGPWIMYDIQSFLSAMWWTKHERNASSLPDGWLISSDERTGSGRALWVDYPTDDDACAPARSTASSNWASSSWGGSPQEYYFAQRISLKESHIPGNGWFWQSYRTRSEAYDDANVPTGLTYDLDLYAKPGVYGGFVDNPVIYGADLWWLIIYKTGLSDLQPICKVGYENQFVPDCSPARTCLWTGNEANRIDDLGWVYKWEFTNRN